MHRRVEQVLKKILQQSKSEKNLVPNERRCRTIKDMTRHSVVGRPMLSTFLPEFKGEEVSDQIEMIVLPTTGPRGISVPAIWAVAGNKAAISWSLLVASPDGRELSPEKVLSTARSSSLLVTGRTLMCALEKGSLIGVFCQSDEYNPEGKVLVYEFVGHEPVPDMAIAIGTFRKVATVTGYDRSRLTVDAGMNIRFQEKNIRRNIGRLARTTESVASFSSTLYHQYANLVRAIATHRVKDFSFLWDQTPATLRPENFSSYLLTQITEFRNQRRADKAAGAVNKLWNHQVPFGLRRVMIEGEDTLILALPNQTPRSFVLTPSIVTELCSPHPWMAHLLKAEPSDKPRTVYYNIRR